MTTNGNTHELAYLNVERYLEKLSDIKGDDKK